jgi:hypothetical protein
VRWVSVRDPSTGRPDPIVRPTRTLVGTGAHSGRAEVAVEGRVSGRNTIVHRADRMVPAEEPAPDVVGEPGAPRQGSPEALTTTELGLAGQLRSLLVTGRRLKRSCLIAIAFAAGSTLAACSSGSSNDSMSAASLLASAVTNADNAGWVHEEVQSSGSGHTLSMSNAVGTSEGQQVITPDGAHATVRLTGGVAYIEGDSQALKSYFGLAGSVPSQFAGKWISIRRSDSGFSTVSASLTLRSDFSQVRLTGRLTKSPVTDIDGQQVIPVRGDVTAPGGGGSVTGTLYVTAQGQVLPVELHASGQPGTETTVWSRWGQVVQLKVPGSAVPISSLGS